jgi:hypothetical protein
VTARPSELSNIKACNERTVVVSQRYCEFLVMVLRVAVQKKIMQPNLVGMTY